MIKALHHVSLAVRDMDRARRFYTGVLGLQPCPAKTNWLRLGDGYALHLMPAKTDPPAFDGARHMALAVDRLEDAVALLLRHGLRPYQVNVDQSGRHDIRSAEDGLAFGIGTIFVEDPDGNTVEFVQPGRGILGEILGQDTGSSGRLDRPGP